MGRREDLVAAVRTRIGRIGETQDFSLPFVPEVLDGAGELAGTLRDDPMGLPVRHALGWLSCTRRLALPPADGAREREMALSLFEPVFALGHGSVPTGLRTLLAERSLPTAGTPLEAAGEHTADATAEPAVRILRSLPTTHPAWAPLARRAGGAREHSCSGLGPWQVRHRSAERHGEPAAEAGEPPTESRQLGRPCRPCAWLRGGGEA